ncbi:uncharacterized protein LOC135136270 [Zophobas morio]|uniref:uncharacterized protein LOC135136270 n=1 Tax=Zophobas morio TaxID=2755281 RepID=UPI003083CBC2
MQPCQMSLLFISGLFSVSSNVIPTKEEQANLLTDVQEVFEHAKLLVDVEANSTDSSVVSDVTKMVERAKDKLRLIEQLSISRMTFTSNTVCMLESKHDMEKLARLGAAELEACVSGTADAVAANSLTLKNSTGAATQRGQELLDTLYACSRKPGLQVISCYKDVIAKDVAPVKRMLLGAIEAHREGHFRTIEIRDAANNCVDDVIGRYRAKMATALKEGLSCV